MGCDMQNLPKYGAPAPCKPVKPQFAKQGEIKWAWFPEFSMIKLLVGISIVFLLLGLLLMIMGAYLGGAAIAFGVIFFLAGLGGLFVFLNWKWNADKQGAYKVARGKSVQAVELWESIDPQYLYQAKDTFFEAKYGGKTLRVLRDGTIEVHGGHENIGGMMSAVTDSLKAGNDVGNTFISDV